MMNRGRQAIDEDVRRAGRVGQRAEHRRVPYGCRDQDPMSCMALWMALAQLYAG
jgi:hypothetical protein